MSDLDKLVVVSQGRKSIRPDDGDLQTFYSGLKVEELEYIHYSRADEESEPHNEYLEDTSAYGSENVASLSEDMLMEYEESMSVSMEEFQSYRCSTPTSGRKHRRYFPRDSELSGLGSAGQSRVHSIVSVYGDGKSSSGSLEDLLHIDTPNTGVRRKIEIDTDIQDPYSYGNVDELELSLEEELSLLQNAGGTSTFGTLKRRLSLKYLRRTTSTGLFGSYLQRTPQLSKAVQSNTGVTSSDGASSTNKPIGPLNFWFRKFRDRHFI